MSGGPRSWTASIVGFALAVLAVCYVLDKASDYLRHALPVLIPVAIVVGLAMVAWRWWRNRQSGW